jgi:hypothetical protein
MVGGEFRGKKFQRDESAEPGVLGFIDDAHSAGANKTNDFVRTQEGACAQRHAARIIQRGGAGTRHAPAKVLWTELEVVHNVGIKSRKR